MGSAASLGVRLPHDVSILMSGGTVLRIDIPKADGGTRPLGISTVADRVAQEVVSSATVSEGRAQAI